MIEAGYKKVPAGRWTQSNREREGRAKKLGLSAENKEQRRPLLNEQVSVKKNKQQRCVFFKGLVCRRDKKERKTTVVTVCV